MCSSDLVEEIGFVAHPEIENAGASPDGLVGKDGLIEIKCPDTKTLIDQLLNKTIPDKYFKQMQWQMDCTDRKWCDYVVFDPRMPEGLQMIIKRVERDHIFIKEMRAEVKKFLNELEYQIKQLLELKNE